MSEIEPIELPDATADPETYRTALLEVLGERDPLDVIAQTPERVRALIHSHDAAALERRPVAGEWSAAEIIGHLLDDEIVTSFRLRLALTEEHVSYPGMDEKRWAALPKPPIEQLFTAWEGLRTINLWLLRSLDRTDWQRVGIHAEQGPETVEVQLHKTAAHDLVHLNQLERCLAK